MSTSDFSPVLSPSDALPERGPFRVGGRILGATEDDTGVLVGDAFGVRAAIVPNPPPIGALCVLSVAEVDARGVLFCDRVEIVGGDRVVDARGERPEGEVARLWAAERAHHLKRRAELVGFVRAFFGARGYLEVETPILVPSPGLDLHLDAFAIGSDKFLATSPEYQMKRLLAGGVPRIFQITRCFRQGEIGARHNPEFTMLEWYRAFSSFEAMIEETEALVVETAIAARGRPEIVHDGRTHSLSLPFERLPICEAFARHAGISAAQALDLALSGRDEDEEQFHRLFVERVEPALAKGPPVVLLDYPSTQASLARKKPSDPRFAERFEILVAGVELCNGFGELVDPIEQRARFEDDRRRRAAIGKPVYPIDERFLAALEEGIPPCAGNALGLDRLIALCLGANSIGDVLAFPEGWL